METRSGRGAPRYPLAVEVELTNLGSGIQIKERTKDLSLSGCGVNTATPFPRRNQSHTQGGLPSVTLLSKNQHKLRLGRRPAMACCLSPSFIFAFAVSLRVALGAVSDTVTGVASGATSVAG